MPVCVPGRDLEELAVVMAVVVVVGDKALEERRCISLAENKK